MQLNNKHSVKKSIDLSNTLESKRSISDDNPNDFSLLDFSTVNQNVLDLIVSFDLFKMFKSQIDKMAESISIH